MSTSDQLPVSSPGDPASEAPSAANPYRAPQVAGADAAAAVRGLQISAAGEAILALFSLLAIVVGQMVVSRQAARHLALTELQEASKAV